MIEIDDTIVGPAGASRSRGLHGRARELAELDKAIKKGRAARLIVVTGPRGRGKTALLRQVLRGRTAVHLETSDLTEAQLLGDFQALSLLALGEAPAPLRPGLLPRASGLGGWLSAFMGIVDRVEASGRPTVLALDGMEALLRARRKLGGAIAEAFHGAKARGLPLKLLLTARDPRTLEPLIGPNGTLGAPDLEIALSPLPFRAAAWEHGGTDPADAFRRWALFGDHPAHLPRNSPGRSLDPDSPARPLDHAVIDRVLRPDGDLYDAPLRRLEVTFHRPGRYAAILRAMARGSQDWSGILERAPGVDSGGQMAPYLRRLEEEGLVRAELPLDARPGSRTRRYSITDPLTAFWFGWVLPHRSLLTTIGATQVWRTHLAPSLEGHFQFWMEEAARRWLRDHSTEALGASSREVGALWGGEADFPVAGMLANGRVCFGLVDWDGKAGDLAGDMAERMKASRYGIGREARTPIFFLSGAGDESVRRMVARIPYASVVDLGQLMGPVPASS